MSKFYSYIQLLIIDKLCGWSIHFDRMHLVEHIRGIIFRLDLLQLAQVGAVNVGNGGVTSYIS